MYEIVYAPNIKFYFLVRRNWLFMHGVAKSRTQLSNFHPLSEMHPLRYN